jgi:ABC-2 type transport system ATP-binding protein
VRALRDEQGMTILLTTHYMEEAEALADQVGIIDHGKLVVEGAPAELVRSLGSDIVHLSGEGHIAGLSERLRLLPFVQKIHGVPAAEVPSAYENETAAAAGAGPASGAAQGIASVDGGPAPHRFRLQIGVDNGDRRLAQIVTTASSAGIHIHEISVARPSLGDVFLAHTGHALRD